MDVTIKAYKPGKKIQQLFTFIGLVHECFHTHFLPESSTAWM